MIVAGIDIGTNTILMAIVRTDGNQIVEVIYDGFAVARLGEGLSVSRNINTQAAERAVQILTEYSELCKIHKVEHVIAVATSAMREAANSLGIKALLESVLNCQIDIISGEDEARLSYLGTVDQFTKSALIDIGGGSTELINGAKRRFNQYFSIPVGAVKITENYFNSLPAEPQDLSGAQSYVSELLEQINFQTEGYQFYGVSGTVVTVAATALGIADNELKQIDGYILTSDKVTEVFNKYSVCSAKEIETQFKVNAKRADLITGGCLILETAMRKLNIKELTVSTRGLRFGVIKNFIS